MPPGREPQKQQRRKNRFRIELLSAYKAIIYCPD